MFGMSAVEILFVIFVLSLSIPILINRSRSQKKSEEIRAKTIRYFRWDREDKCLVVLNNRSKELTRVEKGGRYKYLSIPTGDSLIHAVKFFSNGNISCSEVFYLKHFDSFTLEAIAENMGVKTPYP